MAAPPPPGPPPVYIPPVNAVTYLTDVLIPTPSVPGTQQAQYAREHFIWSGTAFYDGANYKKHLTRKYFIDTAGTGTVNFSNGFGFPTISVIVYSPPPPPTPPFL